MYSQIEKSYKNIVNQLKILKTLKFSNSEIMTISQNSFWKYDDRPKVSFDLFSRRALRWEHGNKVPRQPFPKQYFAGSFS